MHKFTPSTAEERKAHRVEVKDILSKMLDTEVTLSSSKLTYLSGRGISFKITGTLELTSDVMSNGRYSVQSTDLDTCIWFTAGDVESALVYDDAASGNTISLN